MSWPASPSARPCVSWSRQAARNIRPAGISSVSISAVSRSKGIHGRFERQGRMLRVAGAGGQANRTCWAMWDRRRLQLDACCMTAITVDEMPGQTPYFRREMGPRWPSTGEGCSSMWTAGGTDQAFVSLDRGGHRTTGRAVPVRPIMAKQAHEVQMSMLLRCGGLDSAELYERLGKAALPGGFGDAAAGEGPT